MFSFKRALTPAARGLRRFHISAKALDVTEIHDTKQFNQVVLKDPNAFVDFYATWCGPCKAISPFVEQLSKDYDGKLNFYKVDIDKMQDISTEYGVSAVPTFVYFKGGEKVLATVGGNPRAIKTMITRAEEF